MGRSVNAPLAKALIVYMSIFARLLCLVFVLTPFSIGAETDCQERIEYRKPPALPGITLNFARIAKQNDGCFVVVEFELDEMGQSHVVNSNPSSKGCDVFADSASKSVEASKFTSGTSETCKMKIRFEFEP